VIKKNVKTDVDGLGAFEGGLLVVGAFVDDVVDVEGGSVSFVIL
jgi:hypothetical protein